eukprot:scaffold16163_cov106-Isochrysis_galbana.AAC.4
MTDPLTEFTLTEDRERSTPGMSHTDTHTPLHGPTGGVPRRHYFQVAWAYDLVPESAADAAPRLLRHAQQGRLLRGALRS